MQITRRSFFAASLAVPFAASARANNLPGEPFAVSDQEHLRLPIWFRRQAVDYVSAEPKGSIVVLPHHNFLYLILGNNRAVRFGIGTGKYGDWTAPTIVGRMEKWPIWTPTQDHIKRRPDLTKYLAGMPGGLDNPMGARAIYLYDAKGDTSYRIHGTDRVENVGTKSTAGCFALLNADVIWLYDRVKLGTRVLVLKD
jgi:lipoprotein-anchoring transpeptidase ErfK/SrfK